ncbi:MAG: isocitrate lyase/phosphoenolpyruvate mutase family protein [Rhodospirillales bacterium]
MTEEIAARRAHFRALHREGCFVLPNPWDGGSARRLERLGFAALASTSSGAAWGARPAGRRALARRGAGPPGHAVRGRRSCR